MINQDIPQPESEILGNLVCGNETLIVFKTVLDELDIVTGGSVDSTLYNVIGELNTCAYVGWAQLHNVRRSDNKIDVAKLISKLKEARDARDERFGPSDNQKR